MNRSPATMRTYLHGSIALITGIAIGLLGCNRSNDDVVVAPRNPNAATPTSQDLVAASAPQEIATDLDPVPPLGASTIEKHGDEIWRKFSDGMVIYDIKPGTGLMPQVGQTVHVHYKGMFPDGRIFDQSTDKEFKFVLGTRNVIKGWNIALSTMQVGGKRKVLIPSKLAYGPKGNLPLIYPNQDLLFEIELLAITGKPANLPSTQPADTQALVAPTFGPATSPAPSTTAPK